MSLDPAAHLRPLPRWYLPLLVVVLLVVLLLLAAMLATMLVWGTHV